MSIVLQLKNAAASLKGSLFRTAVMADSATTETAINELQANVASLQTSGSVPVWSSGGTYAVGSIVYSPTSFHNYRNKTGAAGTDPAGDTTNWQLIEFSGKAQDITVTPAGGIASTNAQTALEELDSEKSAKTQIQDGSLVSFSATLTGTEFAATPAPAIAAYAANQTFNLIFGSACPAAPTLKLNGIATPPNLVKQNSNGSYSNLAAGDFPAGWQSPVKLVSATQALVLLLPINVLGRPLYAMIAGSGSQINGWTYANNVVDAANDLDISSGSGLDSTRAYFITGAALTKQSDVAWAVGTNAGMLDTGAVGNSDYYLWAIARSDTGVVDYLSSLSNTAPTMPASYDHKRLIGWFKRVGGTIVAFHTYETEGGGLELLWDSPTLDVNLANTLTTSRRTDAIKVPQNFSVIANLNARIYDAAAPNASWIYCPDQFDTAPSQTATPLGTHASTGSGDFSGQVFVRTSSTGTIAARSTQATVDVYQIVTIGFTWARRS